MARPYDRALMAKRDAEFERTGTPAEFDALAKRWASEDSAAEAAASWQVEQVQDLRRRLAVLERTLGADGRRLIDVMVGAIGDAIRRVREEEREHYQAELDRRGYVTYAGTWDSEQDYARGAMITHAGATWIALTPCSKGEKPGRAPAWRMCAKGETAKEPVLR